MNNKKVMQEHMRERFGKVFNAKMNPPLPKSLNIELNNTCNQKCVFCPYHGEYAVKKMKPAVLSSDFVKDLLKQAKNLGIGEKEVGFYLAGEAFLYNELPEIISYAKQLGFPYVFLTTNGALANEEKMKAVIDAGLDSIRYSVNAADAAMYKELHGKDDFATVLQNIKSMNEYVKKNACKIATSLSCVITKKTLGIESSMKSIFSKYVDEIVFFPVILERLNNIDKLNEMYKVVSDEETSIDKSWICPVLFDTMYINALGQVAPCCYAYDDDVYFADLKNDSDMEKAWHSDGFLRYRSIFLHKASDEGTICHNCSLRKRGIGSTFYYE